MPEGLENTVPDPRFGQSDPGDQKPGPGELKKGWTSSRLSALFRQKGPWVVDGAMGTRLLAKGWQGPTHLANLTKPEWVAEIHESWLGVGARIHRTNSFLMLPALAWPDLGLTFDPFVVFENAVSLGLRLLGKNGALLAAFGPVAPSSLPPDAPPAPRFVDLLKRTDGILLETWSHSNAALWGQWLREATDLPLILSWTFRKNNMGVLGGLGGLSVLESISLAEKAGAIATGCNCGLDLAPEDYLQLVGEFERGWSGPLWFCPSFENGSQPLIGWTHLPGLDRMMLGGCCGSKPDDGALWKTS